MTDFDHEDLARAEEKGFALGFYLCWSYIHSNTAEVLHEDDVKADPKLRKIDSVLSATFSTSLEYLDDVGLDTVWSRAKGWLKHYEEEAEAQEPEQEKAPRGETIPSEEEEP